MVVNTVAFVLVLNPFKSCPYQMLHLPGKLCDPRHPGLNIYSSLHLLFWSLELILVQRWSLCLAAPFFIYFFKSLLKFLRVGLDSIRC